MEELEEREIEEEAERAKEYGSFAPSVCLLPN